MGNPLLTPRERFTYRHYRTWPDEERWELIEGRAFSMSAAPNRFHQTILGRLYLEFATFLKGRPCKVFLAPFDVLLPWGDEEDDEVDTVVQPDLAVFCDRGKLTKAGARGAPDLVVEILSPSTSKKDMKNKFILYERQGVREYWVVDVWAWSLTIFRPGPEGTYDEGEIREKDRDERPLGSSVLEGLVIDPVELFADLD
jgi:Uma2 family endonuclease